MSKGCDCSADTRLTLFHCPAVSPSPGPHWLWHFPTPSTHTFWPNNGTVLSIIPAGIVLADDVTACESTLKSWSRRTILENQIHFDELGYSTLKSTVQYQQALDLCAKGGKERCLILEDDIVFTNSGSNLLQRIRVPHDVFQWPKMGVWLFVCGSGVAKDGPDK